MDNCSSIGFYQKYSKPCQHFFVGECVNFQNLKESNGGQMRLDLLIPLVILVFCFLLSLGVIIYQRRLIRINNRQPCHKYEASEQAHQRTKFGTYLLHY